MVQIKSIKQYLNNRECDEVYSKYSNINVNSSLKKFIVDEIYSPYWKSIFNIKFYKDYYEDGITLSQFINNILRKVTTKRFNLAFKEFSEYIRTKSNGRYSIEDIGQTIYYQMFYMNYKGFLFEDMVEEYVKDDGFGVVTNKELDVNYKIDLLLKHKGYGSSIGIQCKNISYMNVDKKTKYEHLKFHKKAIKDGVCDTVIFILYDDDFNIYNINGIPIKERLVDYLEDMLLNLDIKKYL